MFSLARGDILITQIVLVNNMVGIVVVGCYQATQGYQESNVPKLHKVNGQILGAAEFDNTFGWDNKHVRAEYFFPRFLSFTVLQTKLET